jgi:hypothetical protein
MPLVPETKCLSIFIRTAKFTNSSSSFTLVLYFFLPFCLQLDCLTYTNTYMFIPSALGKHIYESDIWSQEPITWLLGAFAKLRKATISFVMSFRLSPRLYVRLSAWNNSAPTGRIFMKFVISVSKICPENPSCIKIS